MSVRRGSAVIVDVPNDNPNEPDAYKRRGGVVLDDSNGIATVAYLTKIRRYPDSVVVQRNTRGIGPSLQIQYDSYFNGDVVRVPSGQLTEKCFVLDRLTTAISEVAAKKLTR